MPARATETKGVHACACGLPVGYGPRLQPSCNAQPQIVEGDLRIGSFEECNAAGLQNANSLDDHRLHIGQSVEVLVEGLSKHGNRQTESGPRQLTGRRVPC